MGGESPRSSLGRLRFSRYWWSRQVPTAVPASRRSRKRRPCRCEPARTASRRFQRKHQCAGIANASHQRRNREQQVLDGPGAYSTVEMEPPGEEKPFGLCLYLWPRVTRSGSPGIGRGSLCFTVPASPCPSPLARATSTSLTTVPREFVTFFR